MEANNIKSNITLNEYFGTEIKTVLMLTKQPANEAIIMILLCSEQPGPDNVTSDSFKW